MTFLLALLLCQPDAKIVGPEKAKPGDLIILDASASKGTGHVWRLIASDKTFLPVDGGTKCVFASGDAGVYTFVLAVADGGKCSLAVHAVTVGTPAPPKPPDPPGPGPTPDPSPAGPRTVLIVHETADKTPQWAATINSLRTGPPAAYLKSKGHRLNIIDDDSLAGDAKWTAILSGMTLPVVIVTDKSDAIIRKQSVPMTATADQIIEIVKGAGG